MSSQKRLTEPELALALAAGARSLRDLFVARHGLLDLEFADAYAQSLTYHLLCERYLAQHGVPRPPAFFTSPITFALGQDKNDPHDPLVLVMNELTHFLDHLDLGFALGALGPDSKPTIDGLVRFYEPFLRAYDKSARNGLGVFYTPKPVVSYIVRSVHEILQEKFQLEDGLADITTWAEMAKRNNGLAIPQGTSASKPFVQILDPATGSGIFLLEVIEQIHQTLRKKWKAEGRTEDEIGTLWNAYVPEHLLPRLVGYEVSFSPYTIAFLLVGLKLCETGYQPKPEDTPRIFLRNALEPVEDAREERYTVVLGNPPYRSLSQNRGDWIKELLASFREVNGIPIKEKGNRNHLQDDYVKFIRLALFHLERSNAGVCGLITNHGYLFGPTFRGMRFYLKSHLSGGRFLDLNGNAKRSAPKNHPGDENIFAIQQGVAIGLFWIREAKCEKPMFEFASIFGSRSDKLRLLTDNDNAKIPFREIHPEPDLFLFEAPDLAKPKEYKTWWKLDEVMPFGGTGIKTNRDGFVIDFEDAPLLERMRLFRDPSVSDEVVQNELHLKENYTWKISKQRRLFREADQHNAIVDLAYRPFDQRRLYYQRHVVYNPRSGTMAQARENNIFLLTCRQQFQTGFRHVFVTRQRFECCLVSAKSREITSGFPIFVFSRSPDDTVERRYNFESSFLRTLEEQIESPVKGESVFSYIYAILHSELYRQRYAESLKLDFPRIPLPLTRSLFDALATHGDKLVALHLLESRNLVASEKTQLLGPRPVVVDHVVWSDGVVWVNRNKKNGFAAVSREVWEFQIGGYRVCEKWLKERIGRTLSDEDIQHYQTIVAVIAETRLVMRAIDEVIDAFGGMPGAFVHGSCGLST